MSELRRNPVSLRDVVCAPRRGARPRRGAATADQPCPFCPGNEALLPEILAAAPAPEPPFWRTRIVPNKYPIPGGEGAAAFRGRHEIVVESPRHDADLATMSPAERRAVVEAWVTRTETLWRDPAVRAVFPFRNHRAAAGASLGHPHSQIVATGRVPPQVAVRERAARRAEARTGRTPLGALCAEERADGRRMVAETAGWLAFVPRAAEAPCELWLAPPPGTPAFAALPEDGRAALAALLGEALGRLAAALEDPPYNLVVHMPSRAAAARGATEWFVRIFPRVAGFAGFELGSGLAVNPSCPEADAARLRAVRR